MLKKILTLLLIASAWNAGAQYFKGYYGTADNDRINDGHTETGLGQNRNMVSTTYNSSGFTLVAQSIDLFGASLYNNTYDFSINSISYNSSDHKSVSFMQGAPVIGTAVAGVLTDKSTSLDYCIYYAAIDAAGNVVTATGYIPSLPVGYTDIHVVSITHSNQNLSHFYICGYVVLATGGNRVFSLKVDNAGSVIWSNVFDLDPNLSVHFDTPSDLVETPTQVQLSSPPYSPVVVYGYELAIAGKYSDNGIDYDAFILRVDANTGSVCNSTLLFGTSSSMDEFTSIITTNSTTGLAYVCSGNTNVHGNFDFWALEINQMLATISWSAMFDYFDTSGQPAQRDNYCNAIIERYNFANSSREFYLVGYTERSFHFGAKDVMVIHINQFGMLFPSGQFIYGDLNDDIGYRIDIDDLTGADGITIFAENDNSMVFSSTSNYDPYIIRAYYNGVTSTQNACQYSLDNNVDGAGPAGISTLPSVDWKVLQPTSLVCSIGGAQLENIVCEDTYIQDGSNARSGQVKPARSLMQVNTVPNPMRSDAGEVKVNILTSGYEMATVTIMDLMGRSVTTSNFILKNGENMINLSLGDKKLKSGTYLINVKTMSETLKTILVVY